MKFKHYLLAVALLTAVYALPQTANAQRPGGGSRQGTNRVEGTIRDRINKPVYNAFVELYNDLGQLVDRQRSTTQGRFAFKGMGPGRYVVHVKPFGTNLRGDEQELEVNNQTTGSDFVMMTFRLIEDTRKADGEVSIVGTVFAQQVPDDAKKLYAAGIDSLNSDRKQALTSLEDATKTFPTYFDALAALGKAYILGGDYEKGYPFLIRAIDVNPKCADCYYSMALAFYKLNQVPASIKAIEAAVLISPQVPTVRLLQGMIYKLNNDLPAAEKALLTAKSLSKDPDPEIHMQLSLLYNRMKRNSDAANELEAYLKADPDISSSQKQELKKVLAKLRAAK